MAEETTGDMILAEIRDLKRRVEYLEKMLMSRPIYVPYPEPYYPNMPWNGQWVVTCSNKHC